MTVNKHYVPEAVFFTQDIGLEREEEIIHYILMK